MPLHDHFRPPLSLQEQWQAFHHTWATLMALDLNTRLPKGYHARPSIQFNVEFDVSALRRGPPPAVAGTWDPGEPSGSLSVATALDTAEVQVFSTEAGPVLVGIIELVSPSNKDRPAEREAFVDKCAALLHRRVGVIVVDTVTTRRANLHHELARRLDARAGPLLDADLYAVSYRLLTTQGKAQVVFWERVLAVGVALPTMPFWLRDLCVPVDLEATYERTWQGLQIDLGEAASGNGST